ncbi:hypothetical protein Y1Q_0013417 [Alligator mississippiensis]|uniref:Ig-like domain-containing protein n=1 Tax=Alligator mississippiensis TaxID=8496 RepID=A0A151MR44_ALLMI|nr:hypothetical protein Y1Q_0013417 [Alligator mississippiensis]
MEGMCPKDVTMAYERIHSKDMMVSKSNNMPWGMLPALPQGCRVTEERAGTHLMSYLSFTLTMQDYGTQIWSPVAPVVSEISQPKSMAMGKRVILSCRIAGHFPGELSVTWLWRGKGEDTAVTLWDSAECRVEHGMAVLAQDRKSFQQEMRFICWMSQDQGAECICRMGHLALETPIESSGKF